MKKFVAIGVAALALAGCGTEHPYADYSDSELAEEAVATAIFGEGYDLLPTSCTSTNGESALTRTFTCRVYRESDDADALAVYEAVAKGGLRNWSFSMGERASNLPERLTFEYVEPLALPS